MPRVACVRSSPIERTARVMQLEGLFDVPPAERSEVRWAANLPIEDKPWNVGLIVGPSGCGKSTLARELFGAHLVDGFAWPKGKAVVDGFPAGMSIKDITGLLSSVGFSSPPSWLRPFAVLSNGEQFRATMARALAELPDLSVIDEFTSVVDRTVAQVASAAHAKTVRRLKRRFVAVSCHYDIVEWLQPDWTYEPASDTFAWRCLQRPQIKLEIVRADRSTWRLFRPHHYLSGDIHRSARCFVALVAGRPAAFASVLSFPHAIAPSFREHRSVCLSDFQGVGIGTALSDFVASLYVTRGKPYISITSHPAMIAHRRRSPLWQCQRAPSLADSLSRRSTASWMKPATNRLTSSWRYIGPPADPAHVAALLPG